MRFVLLALLGWSQIAVAEEGWIERFGNIPESVLVLGSRVLHPGLHVLECADGLDVYVTERVPMGYSLRAASQRARLRALRTLTEFVHGTVGVREQRIVNAEQGDETESVRYRVRNRARTDGLIAGLELAGRMMDGDAVVVIFVLPVSDVVATASCG